MGFELSIETVGNAVELMRVGRLHKGCQQILFNCICLSYLVESLAIASQECKFGFERFGVFCAVDYY